MIDRPPERTGELPALDRVVGCLLGGAIGDALGANVEFEPAASLRERFGEVGIRDFVDGEYPAGSITDDTQMTLFTCEGLIRAESQLREHGDCKPIEVLHRAYLRWLATQEGAAVEGPDAGFLVREPVLRARRAPGATCIGALRTGVVPARNDSKGCGAVMRSAPFGVLVDRYRAFELARDAASITHGHPTGAIAAGALASIVHDLLRGVPLPDAVIDAIDLARDEDAGRETARALDRALWESHQGYSAAGAVELLGEGWVAEEALAIAVLAALIGQRPLDALSIAVTHGGDSDSTGAICGNLLGAMSGTSGLPGELVERVEGRDLVVRVATDLHAAVVEGVEPSSLDYPPS